MNAGFSVFFFGPPATCPRLMGRDSCPGFASSVLPSSVAMLLARMLSMASLPLAVRPLAWVFGRQPDLATGLLRYIVRKYLRRLSYEPPPCKGSGPFLLIPD
ncbi:hypothetical protein GQ53DRAFT_355898 [Thozetella sp. PMI_491]|nr:hypothetical protein GQ53DRAFT_355898 [Thozetella sp. PMI_491]